MRYVIALGSNMGDRVQNLRSAVGAFDTSIEISPVYETEPQGGPAGQSLYLNMAVAIDSEWMPLDMLSWCQQLEERAGRVRTVQNGPRTLDVDIVSAARIEMVSDRLTLPHPRAAERQFVLRPVSDVDLHVAQWIRLRAGYPPYVDESSPPRQIGALGESKGVFDFLDESQPLTNRKD